jgi:hypothetical protein
MIDGDAHITQLHAIESYSKERGVELFLSTKAAEAFGTRQVTSNALNSPDGMLAMEEMNLLQKAEFPIWVLLT